MNKIKIWMLFLTFTLISQSAFGMENAPDAENDGRTVVIASGSSKFCTGFLYSERIVLTAAHCIVNRSTNNFHNFISVGLPGEKYTQSSTKINAEKFFIPDGWEWDNDNNMTAINDFGIIILSQPIKIVGKTFIASKENIDTYLKNNIMISTIGYGRQSSVHQYSDDTFPKYAEFPLVQDVLVKGKLSTIWAYFGKEKRYDMKIHVLQVPGGPSSCSGDSGSPFYVKDKENFVYLGPLAWGIGGIPNCSGNGWNDSSMYMGSVAAYDYLDLIKEAEKYVGIQSTISTVNPIKKITIKCYRGKSIKKISSVKPKCPKGYKVRV